MQKLIERFVYGTIFVAIACSCAPQARAEADDQVPLNSKVREHSLAWRMCEYLILMDQTDMSEWFCTDYLLAYNGLTWEEARHLREGYVIRIPHDMSRKNVSVAKDVAQLVSTIGERDKSIAALEERDMERLTLITGLQKERAEWIGRAAHAEGAEEALRLDRKQDLATILELSARADRSFNQLVVALLLCGVLALLCFILSRWGRTARNDSNMQAETILSLERELSQLREQLSVARERAGFYLVARDPDEDVRAADNTPSCSEPLSEEDAEGVRQVRKQLREEFARRRGTRTPLPRNDEGLKT